MRVQRGVVGIVAGAAQQELQHCGGDRAVRGQQRRRRWWCGVGCGRIVRGHCGTAVGTEAAPCHPCTHPHPPPPPHPPPHTPAVRLYRRPCRRVWRQRRSVRDGAAGTPGSKACQPHCTAAYQEAGDDGGREGAARQRTRRPARHARGAGVQLAPGVGAPHCAAARGAAVVRLGQLPARAAQHIASADCRGASGAVRRQQGGRRGSEQAAPAVSRRQRRRRRRRVMYEECATLTDTSGPLSHLWCPRRGPWRFWAAARRRNAALTGEGPRVLCDQVQDHRASSPEEWDGAPRSEEEEVVPCFPNAKPLQPLGCLLQRSSSRAGAIRPPDNVYEHPACGGPSVGTCGRPAAARRSPAACEGDGKPRRQGGIPRRGRGALPCGHQRCCALPNALAAPQGAGAVVLHPRAEAARWRRYWDRVGRAAAALDAAALALPPAGWLWPRLTPHNALPPAEYLEIRDLRQKLKPQVRLVCSRLPPLRRPRCASGPSWRHPCLMTAPPPP